jgi:hypothetical protein
MALSVCCHHLPRRSLILSSLQSGVEGSAQALYQLNATTPPGVGRDLRIVVSVPGGMSRSSDSFTFSYAPPVITDLVRKPRYTAR